jgi:hypothetical protein
VCLLLWLCGTMCGPKWHSSEACAERPMCDRLSQQPLAAGRMSFSLRTMDCRGIRGEGNRVVTTCRCSSQAVFGPINRAFPSLRSNPFTRKFCLRDSFI